jgi:hypothetical protein
MKSLIKLFVFFLDLQIFSDFFQIINVAWKVTHGIYTMLVVRKECVMDW